MLHVLHAHMLEMLEGNRACWYGAELALPGMRQVAEECLGKAGDLSGLLLLHTAKGSAAGLAELVALAQGQSRQNIAFLCQLLLGNLGACIDILLEAGRVPEAAFFARTYLPSRISEVQSCIQQLP
jgi:coatomer subunit beta'